MLATPSAAQNHLRPAVAGAAAQSSATNNQQNVFAGMQPFEFLKTDLSEFCTIFCYYIFNILF
jgi:hypothetical protein